jgi:hypothetical protein
MHVSPFYLAATLALGVGAVSNRTKSCVCSNRALEQCLIAKHVPYKVPCDSDYAGYSLTHNLRLPIKPAAIVLPKDSSQVSGAVICAGRSGVKVQAKSGGRMLLALPSAPHVSSTDISTDRLVWVIQLRRH